MVLRDKNISNESEYYNKILSDRKYQNMMLSRFRPNLKVDIDKYKYVFSDAKETIGSKGEPWLYIDVYCDDKIHNDSSFGIIEIEFFKKTVLKIYERENKLNKLNG